MDREEDVAIMGVGAAGLMTAIRPRLAHGVRVREARVGE
jgi:predicted flavoprotein YhiN